MEKSGDLSGDPGFVTPSAPPTYLEAVGGNMVSTTTGFYPSVPYDFPPAGPAYPSHMVSSVPVQSAPQAYGIQQNVVPGTVIGVRTSLPVGPKSLKTSCPSCQKSMCTRTVKKNCLMKYCCCLLLIGSVICIPCACLPFCMCGPTRIEHFCPKCNAYLGTYVKH